MCGVAALFRLPGTQLPERVLEQMTELVRHRGPDGAGLETLALGPGEPWRVGLGHRRLSIIDLSSAGRQPMSDAGGRLWVCFNGEIYNYVELRRELTARGHGFRTATDTEVILAAYREWGSAGFAHLRGMWGFVLVDLDRRKAWLSRDRLGIKPLYLCERPGVTAVVSELKQLGALPGAARRADDVAVARYLATGFEDQTQTFFAGVRPIPPGTSVELDLDTLGLGNPQPYWFPERIGISIRDRAAAAEAFTDAFEEAVRLHMRSDVPVGCALSGGLDSSAIAGCVAALPGALAGPLETFSVTFPGEAIDERPWIDRVVARVGARAHFVTPAAADFARELDDFIWHHDEPVGSLSQYAGWAVARLTRAAGVPVTLNGQGGDEVLSGYWQNYFVYLRRLASERRGLTLGAHLLGAMLPGGNPELVRQAPAMLRRYRARAAAAGHDATSPVARAGTMDRAAFRLFELRELTLPRLLKWDDRNFMAFSVEGRYPFLDHVLIERCLAMDPEVLYERGWTKEPLRRGLRGRLPEEILRRRSKVGFETPQGAWLIGPLAAQVERLVSAHDTPVWQHVEPTWARALWRRVQASALRPAGREDAQAMLRVLLVDRWLRRFDLASGRAPRGVTSRSADGPDSVGLGS